MITCNSRHTHRPTNTHSLSHSQTRRSVRPSHWRIFVEQDPREGGEGGGTSMNDVMQIFRVFGPPCPQLGLIYSTKSMQPPLLNHVFSLQCAKSSMDGPLGGSGRNEGCAGRPPQPNTCGKGRRVVFMLEGELAMMVMRRAQTGPYSSPDHADEAASRMIVPIVEGVTLEYTLHSCSLERKTRGKAGGRVSTKRSPIRKGRKEGTKGRKRASEKAME